MRSTHSEFIPRRISRLSPVQMVLSTKLGEAESFHLRTRPQGNRSKAIHVEAPSWPASGSPATCGRAPLHYTESSSCVKYPSSSRPGDSTSTRSLKRFLARRQGRHHEVVARNPSAPTLNTVAHIYPEARGVQASTIPPPPIDITSHMTSGPFRIRPY